MKVICYAGALEEGWSAGEARPRGRTQKDKGGRMKLSGPERRARRNRKKGRNAQGKSVISFCACGYDISNRLPPAPTPLFSPPARRHPVARSYSLSSLYRPSGESSQTLELCKRQGRVGGKSRGWWVVGWVNGCEKGGGMQIKILAIFPFLIFHGGSQLQRPSCCPIIIESLMRNYDA